VSSPVAGISGTDDLRNPSASFQGFNQARIVDGQGGKPGVANPLSIPPTADGITARCKAITVQDRPDITRRYSRKGIGGEPELPVQVLVSFSIRGRSFWISEAAARSGI